MELEYLKVANNPIMWISVLPGVLLVIVQAIVLSRRAIVSGRKMGITERQFKSAIRSSALASIGPSLIIVTGMIALLSSMGGPIAWMRLAYIGAVNFELSAADRAASAVGCTLGTSNMTMEAFACAVYTMVYTAQANASIVMLEVPKVHPTAEAARSAAESSKLTAPI